MTWRQTIDIQPHLKTNETPHKKADCILMVLAENIKECDMGANYDAVAHDFALVRKQEELDHALENLYTWANENMIWLG